MVSSKEFDAFIAEWGLSRAQQLLLVAARLKPACRLRIKREKLPRMAEAAKALSIEMLVGFDLITAEPVSGRCGFAEWGRRTHLTPHQMGDCYVYLCADHLRAQRLRRYDEALDDLAVGELLGYPACCVEWFGQFLQEGKGAGDPVLQKYRSDAPIDWHMNVSLLCFGYSLLSHVPCSSDCGSSEALARNNYQFIGDLSQSFSIKLRRMLLSSVLHTRMLGVVAFDAIDGGEALVVRTVLAVDPASVLGKLVAVGSEIRADQDGIAVDDCHFTGEQIKLFQFGE